MRFFGFALLLALAAAARFWWQEHTAREASTTPVSALERIEVESADGTTEIHLLDRADEVAEAPVDVADGQPPVVDSDASEAAVTPESTPEATGSSATAAPPQQSQPLPLPETGDSAPVPVQAPAVTAPSAATDTPAPVAAPGEAQLELRFTADCWTRVTDADGRVLFSALAKAGTSRTVTARRRWTSIWGTLAVHNSVTTAKR